MRTSKWHTLCINEKHVNQKINTVFFRINGSFLQSIFPNKFYRCYKIFPLHIGEISIGYLDPYWPRKKNKQMDTNIHLDLFFMYIGREDRRKKCETYSFSMVVLAILQYLTLLSKLLTRWRKFARNITISSTSTIYR
jgi:hypothetical protein